MMNRTNIKLIKDIIIRNEDVDNDFWYLGGNQDLQYYLIEFMEDDWRNLKIDLQNWTSHQLSILADALIQKNSHFDSYRENLQCYVSDLYGYIFTLVEDSEADFLIQEIKILNDQCPKSFDMLLAIKNRIKNLEIYTATIHKTHDYEDYYKFIDNLIYKASC